MSKTVAVIFINKFKASLKKFSNGTRRKLFTRDAVQKLEWENTPNKHNRAAVSFNSFLLSK
jgi:hypothetical protein